MHLGNNVICPVTGIPMLIAASAAAIYAFKKAKTGFTKEKIMPACLLTIFVFALQMINFSIFQTGASGHIIGGLLLAMLLGPYVGFLSICAILTVQAVFFADGGLLALGCNIFNMGALACFVAYPFIYKPFAKKNTVLGAFLGSFAAIELGALACIVETYLSSSTSANISAFALSMIGIHFAISLVEGAFSAFIITVANKKYFNYGIACTAIILSGFISNYASNKPDGLEWSLLKISDGFIAQIQGVMYSTAEIIQSKTAILLEISPVIANISALMLLFAVMFALCKYLTLKAE